MKLFFISMMLFIVALIITPIDNMANSVWNFISFKLFGNQKNIFRL